jgi:hypothetical protein
VYTLKVHFPFFFAPDNLKFKKMMNGLFFAFAAIALLANLAGGYVESINNKNEQ